MESGIFKNFPDDLISYDLFMETESHNHEQILCLFVEDPLKMSHPHDLI